VHAPPGGSARIIGAFVAVVARQGSSGQTHSILAEIIRRARIAVVAVPLERGKGAAASRIAGVRGARIGVVADDGITKRTLTRNAYGILDAEVAVAARSEILRGTGLALAVLLVAVHESTRADLGEHALALQGIHAREILQRDVAQRPGARSIRDGTHLLGQGGNAAPARSRQTGNEAEALDGENTTVLGLCAHSNSSRSIEQLVTQKKDTIGEIRNLGLNDDPSATVPTRRGAVNSSVCEVWFVRLTGRRGWTGFPGPESGARLAAGHNGGSMPHEVSWRF
jgi:hypothetical protein